MAMVGRLFGLFRCALLALTIAATWAAPALAQKRLALLIGNNAYQNVPKLSTALGDARALGNALKTLGFTVVVAENQSRQAMSETLLAFDKAIEPGDTVFFFFAGHGFEIHGQNYLLPTDVPDVGEGEEELLRDAAFPAERIVDRLQARGARLAVLVFDACRNNPFERSGRRALKGSRGLAPMTPPEGVFIVFSAGAKQTALDNLGGGDPIQNSVFSRNFVRELKTPGLTLVQIAKRTQTQVKQMAATVRHEQTPAYYDQVVGDVVLQGRGADVAAVTEPQVAAVPSPALPGRAGGQDTVSLLMADLDALAAARNWRELREHLTDVNPSARDRHWDALVEQAAIGELSALEAPGGSFVKRLATIERYYPAFPSLSDSAQFLALRTRTGLAAFAGCFDEGADARKCRDELERFVHIAPLNADLAKAAAHLVGIKFNRQVSALFYATGLDAPGGEAICRDEELVGYDLVVALQLPPDYREAQAGRVVAERCWDQVKTAVVANVAQETSESYYLRNTCGMLLKHHAISGLRETRCRAIAPP
jgi:hypothetical protein